MLEIMIWNFETLIYLISFAVCFIFVTVIFSCVCCRKPRQKNDLLGLDGMVKITNPDENVNHMPTTANCIPANTAGDLHSSVNHDLVNESTAKSRVLGNSNPNRSLPEIPVCPLPGVEVNVDTSSEIYATVDDKSATQPLAKTYLEEDYSQYKNVITANGNNLPRPSLSQQSSLSQADAPYARLKSEHPYDKLRKAEHPYASVQHSDSNPNENKSSNSPGRVRISSDEIHVTSHSPIQRTSTISLATSELTDRGPVAPPRSRRTSSHCSLPITTDIPAATAVAGQIAASQELPYMTPPPLQPNFSGDSQDSSKGYTSISVREPLANIRAQTSAVNNQTAKRPEISDPHYATVSDDSDEMYAAIEEPHQQLYTSGSDTYAQIQPTSVLNNLPSNVASTATVDRNETEQGQLSAPQPPSVDSLRQVAQVHSRQASSSSCTSSVANLGSPKPEKRQANSPLPPRPSVSPELRPGSIERNLEDMYAKVHKIGKKKRDSEDIEKRTSSTEFHIDQLPRHSLPNTNLDMSMSNFSRKSNPQVDAVNRKSWSSRDMIDSFHRDKINHGDSDSVFNSDLEQEIDNSNRNSSVFSEHCYETLNKNDFKSASPKRDKFLDSENHENMQHRHLLPAVKCDTTASGPESFLSNDPGYEVLNHNRPPSDCDPNYEILRPQRSETNSESEQGYSTIKSNVLERNSQKRSSDRKNLQTTNNNIANEYLYSTVSKKSKEVDPGYETVKVKTKNISELNEPNYESMSSDCIDEPNYATVQDKSGSSETDSYYDSVIKRDKFDKYRNDTEPPYERLNNDDSNNTSISSYEKLDNDSINQISTKPSGDGSPDKKEEMTYQNESTTKPGERCEEIEKMNSSNQ